MKTIDAAQLNKQFSGKAAEEVLSWAVKEFGDKVGFASSFGAEDVVVIDMLAKITPHPKIFTLDTGRLNEETYQVMDAIRKKYNLSIESQFPEREKVEALERAKGFFSFRESVENRKECCRIRKVIPLGRALERLLAWITGLRREQSVTRAELSIFETDTGHNNILKINPLADWTEKQVWGYIKKNNVPYNALHDQNYPSIGCAPCTRAIKPGEDIRAGRWWWESPESKECGLHPTKK